MKASSLLSSSSVETLALLSLRSLTSHGRQMPPSTLLPTGGKAAINPAAHKAASAAINPPLNLPRPSSRRGLLTCNAPLVGARSRSPRVGEGATLKRGLVLPPRRLLRFVSARSRSPFLSLRRSGGSSSFVSPHLAAARSTLPPCCPQSNPTALLRTHHQRANAPQATHPLADGLAARQRTRQPDSAQGNPTAHALAPLSCLRYAVAICSLRSQGAIAPLRQLSQASAINPAAHGGTQTP